MAVGVRPLHQMSSALHAESIACLNGQQLAVSLGMQSILLGTDTQNLALALTSSSYDIAETEMFF